MIKYLIFFLNDYFVVFFFIIVVICFRKCSFRIDDLNFYENFFLRKIFLMIDEKKIFIFCLRLYNRRVIYINCLWKVGKFYIRIYMIFDLGYRKKLNFF